MKTVLTILVVGLCYMMIAPLKIERVSDHPTPKHATPATPASVDLSGVPPGLIQEAEQKGYRKEVLKRSFAEYASTEPRLRLFKAQVIQSLDSGHLLIRCSYVKPNERCVSRGTYALWGLPDANRVVDGAEIDGYALPTAIYRYMDTAGSMRTIYELAYFQAPGGKVTSATVAATRPPDPLRDTPHSTLGRPTPVPWSKLTDQQRMAEWAIRVQQGR